MVLKVRSRRINVVGKEVVESIGSVQKKFSTWMVDVIFRHYTERLERGGGGHSLSVVIYERSLMSDKKSEQILNRVTLQTASISAARFQSIRRSPIEILISPEEPLGLSFDIES